MKYIHNFHWWCHKILPLVYDDSLSYYELLCKLMHKLNEVIDITNQTTDTIVETVTEWLNDHQIDVDQEAIGNAVDTWMRTHFNDYINPLIEPAVAEYMGEHPYTPSASDVANAVEDYLDDHPVEVDPADVSNAVDGYLTDKNLPTRSDLDAVKTYVTPLDYRSSDNDTDYDAMIRKMINDINSGKAEGVIPQGTYNINNYYVTDEANLKDNAGTFNNGKILTSKTLNFNIGKEMLHSIDVNAIHAGYSIQGGVYVPTRDSFYLVCFLNNSQTYLLEFSHDFSTLKQNKACNIYHGSGMTYCSKDGYIYAVGGTEDTSHRIYKINPANCAIVGTVNGNETTNVKMGIAYDEKNDVFFVAQNYNLVIYKRDFTVIKTITNAFYPFIMGFPEFGILDGYETDQYQGTHRMYKEVTMFQTIGPVVNGQLLFLFDIRDYTPGASNPFGYYKYHGICQFDYNTGAVKRYWRVNGFSPFAESEHLLWDGNSCYITEVHNLDANIHDAFVSKVFTLDADNTRKTSVLDLQEGGHSIANGTDLNDLWLPGVYYSTTGAQTGTLSNTPSLYSGTTTGFTLIVMNQGATNVRQIFFGQSGTPTAVTRGDIYTRIRNADGSWTAWTTWATINSNYGALNALNRGTIFVGTAGDKLYDYFGSAFVTSQNRLRIQLPNLFVPSNFTGVLKGSPTLTLYSEGTMYGTGGTAFTISSVQFQTNATGQSFLVIDLGTNLGLQNKVVGYAVEFTVTFTRS